MSTPKQTEILGDSSRFGMSDAELLKLPTVYRDDLFKHQVVLVTGGGSGLGKAIAILFARLGATIVIAGRDGAKLERAAELLKATGRRVVTQAMTIRDPAQVVSLIDRTWADVGPINVLINNAGGQFPKAALDFTVKGWNAVIDTNLNGTWYMMQAVARRWVAAEQPGAIINIVADAWRGMPGIAHTCAARAGVIYLSRTVAVEWAPYHIRINCVAPGCVETTAFGRYPAEGAETFQRDANPMKRPGDVQDIAESCVYLAAPSGKFITGEVITVDGGQQLWGDPWPMGRPAYFQR
jgi:citronellol/citronellal dehydrogenase